MFDHDTLSLIVSSLEWTVIVCPVWNDDQWLKDHSGATLEKTEEEAIEDGSLKRPQEEADDVGDFPGFHVTVSLQLFNSRWKTSF